MTPVLDASVFVAAISPSERHHAQARTLYESHPDAQPYLVPSLFRVEVIAALARRGESDELLDVVDALVRSPRFHTCVLDPSLVERTTSVARRARLRAYDAVYLALALSVGAPLYTLDADLIARVMSTYPEIVVCSEA
jgi:predicted nucleic acid-binding protein